ncbi:MAG: DUF116 domain-containing protein [archaeon]
MVDDNYQKIRDAVGKAADAGAHLNVAKVSETIGKSLGLSDSLIQFTHVELRNAVFERDFRKIPIEERMLFLPHCVRNSKFCQATFDDDGYHCKHCGACNLDEAVKLAKRLGYKNIFIVPGGSIVKKILMRTKSKAAIGVCCFNEALLSFDMIKHTSIVPQIVLLLKDGCHDTLINLPLLEEKLAMVEK